MTVTLNIKPQPKPRITHRGRFSDRAKRYYKYAENLRSLMGKNELPDAFRVTFYLPMAKWWSKKKRDERRGTPHQQTPDYSNLLKALEDALHPNDKRIWKVDGQSLWADEGSIEIEPLDGC